MKLTYVDNLRALGDNTWCRWDFKINGKDRAIPIYNTKYTSSTSDNDHTPHAISGTCSDIPAGNHTMTIALTRKGDGTDCYTGWAPESARDAFFMEAEELNPAGQITTAMRKLAGDPLDSGVLSGRSLEFDKRTDASELRITWATNLRVTARDNKAGAHCTWEIQIDGKSCVTPSKIGVAMHCRLGDYEHIPVEVVGWCRDIKRGSHTITAIVSRPSSYYPNSDCHTGWGSNDYMEVWEPTPQEQSMITYMQKVVTSSAAEVSNSLHSHSFTKQLSSSSVRILYFDNFRVIGNQQWCRWEVKVDGKSCTTPLAASVHTKSGDDDHYPGIILGECLGVASGKHRVDVALTNSGSGADCFTGWSLDSIMHVLLEVQEVALCDVPNSNKQPGTACACASGYWGNITWDVQPTGPCTSTCDTPPPYRPMPGTSYTCDA